MMGESLGVASFGTLWPMSRIALGESIKVNQRSENGGGIMEPLH